MSILKHRGHRVAQSYTELNKTFAVCYLDSLINLKWLIIIIFFIQAMVFVQAFVVPI